MICATTKETCISRLYCKANVRDICMVNGAGQKCGARVERWRNRTEESGKVAFGNEEWQKFHWKGGRWTPGVTQAIAGVPKSDDQHE
mmetsp:Transcript_29292/g.80480  ORF Transcript_29292/g.80480 Transcript_29292/m.80480 type:complete len:87 (+) Transcript_29292:307-567(+)